MHVRTNKELKLLKLHQLTEVEYFNLKEGGMLYVYFPEASGIRSQDMKRIDKIGQNGNNGEHYDDNPDGMDFPHDIDDSYATKIEKVYNVPKDGMFVDDYVPDDPTSPSHYSLGNTGVEAIDVIDAVLSKEEFIGYLKGNILKYQLRSNKKNGTEDLRKADIYSGWLAEALEGEEE